MTSAELRDAVNVAISLEKPLLIRGEPGTGKTLLASSIAEGLGMPLIKWHVKSTTGAQEGLYVYDAVQRLQDSRFGDQDVSDISNYIRMGPLGEAFRSEERAVLLIDEVDKADLEFPNDLLHEIDEMSFTIRETQEVVRAEKRPVVLITSNAEKELPDAFLRRCVFHYISFPSESLMRRIVGVHHPEVDEKLLTDCLMRFYWLRERPEVRKKPSTSELVDWIGILVKAGVDPARVRREFPFLGVLLKKESDLRAIQARN
jgi:MoxR-like ATPase